MPQQPSSSSWFLERLSRQYITLEWDRRVGFILTRQLWLIMNQNEKNKADRFNRLARYPYVKDTPFLRVVCLVKAKFHYRTLASSELAPNMLGASSELASVMEFGFKTSLASSSCYYFHVRTHYL